MRCPSTCPPFPMFTARHTEPQGTGQLGNQVKVAAPLREGGAVLGSTVGGASEASVEKEAQAVDKRDGPWGQTLIWALVISSARHG